MAENNVVVTTQYANKINIAKKSFLSIFWNRFKTNKMAVVGLGVISIFILIAVFGPIISPYDYKTLDYSNLYDKPNLKYLLGTDDGGRDMATLIAYSLRNAFIVGFGAGVVELCIGLLLGATAGYFGGKIDNLLMRITDIMFSFPSFLFSLILVLVLGRGILAIFVAIGLTSWAGMARLVRGQVLSIKQSDFIEAGRALGAKSTRIILKYLIPNSVGPLVTALSFNIPYAMVAESGLSLLGLGVMPPMPSWGTLISQGGQYMLSYPHLMIYPALSLAITMLAFSYLADGLRDAFDPKHDK